MKTVCRRLQAQASWHGIIKEVRRTLLIVDIFVPFSFSLFFPPSFPLSISWGRILVWVNLWSQPAPGQLNQRHTAVGIGLGILVFRNLCFSMNPGRKMIQSGGGGRKKIQGGLGFLRAWSRKAVRKGLLWSLNHSIEWEKFQGISNGLAKILKPLQRSAGE